MSSSDSIFKAFAKKLLRPTLIIATFPQDASVLPSAGSRKEKKPSEEDPELVDIMEWVLDEEERIERERSMTSKNTSPVHEQQKTEAPPEFSKKQSLVAEVSEE